MNKNIVVNTLIRIKNILPRKFRKTSIWLLIGIFANSIFEIIGLAALLPLLAAILKDNFIHTNPILGHLYAFFKFESDKSFILVLCLFIFLFIVFKNGFGIWIQKQQALFSWVVHESISSKILKNTFDRGFTYFTGNNSNKILNRIQTIPMQFAQQMLASVFLVTNEIIVLTMILASLLAFDPKILLLLIGIVIPVFTVFYKKNKTAISSLGEDLNELGPKIAKPIFEIVFGYVDVLINGSFKNFLNEYIVQTRLAKSLRIKLLVIQNVPNRLIEICVVLAVMIMLLYGLFFLHGTEKILILMSVFGLAAYRTIPSINRLMLSVVNIQNQQYILNFLEEYLEKEKFQSENNKALKFEDSIQLQNIHYKYSESQKNVISDFSLSIKKGEAIGVVGKSGSGKTTLMNLLLGFIEPTSGEILIDGEKLNETNISKWQERCGYVRQDVFLIDGSVIENVAFGISKEKVNHNKFDEVIKKAQLLEFVHDLPNGKHSNIGERGAKISGGQRQRIGIARALYHGADLLCFDEATSALDTETENEITEAIKAIQDESLTMVIIAHRESTLKYCDKIIKL
ncbi:ABC-type multidrug transport system, ATPase and permease component [Reichenbachiella faecimaris]|uniref:ABC-type multidrug transport system, ATPase and permease component n=1 Tax=Reichenbachiella faecimaris TaxID=692418 RepID=A0A1W2GIX6_REIFA|nr:ABC transporter ATP-binding protein [Reichenbachiella faecimaris]SMD36494.1 ABC-type multidrug transport system, ATPase and permease component [Reichenbachiella faecimaris]